MIRCFTNPQNDTELSFEFIRMPLRSSRLGYLIGLTACACRFAGLPGSPRLYARFRSRSAFDLGFERRSRLPSLPRKEVIQPHLPIRLPCYDFTPVIGLTFGSWLLSVTSLTSGAPNSHGVTGGVYKARERIHRGMLIRDY